MGTFNLPDTTDKYKVFEAISRYLEQLGINVASTDFDRPWGGFFVIDSDSTETFIATFFPTLSRDEIATGLTLTPKILVTVPQQRLSWQYHLRREELWSVIRGPVGVITSANDTQGEVRTVTEGEIISFGTEVRHRLIGLEHFGVVAEFWKHADPSNPSDESDIVRVQDDFSRS